MANEINLKKHQKQDPKLVAFKADDKREVKYIAGRYKIPLDVVEGVMRENGKNGKPARSRFKIYFFLRKLGYVITTRYKKTTDPDNKKAARASKKTSNL